MSPLPLRSPPPLPPKTNAVAFSLLLGSHFLAWRRPIDEVAFAVQRRVFLIRAGVFSSTQSSVFVRTSQFPLVRRVTCPNIATLSIAVDHNAHLAVLPLRREFPVDRVVRKRSNFPFSHTHTPGLEASKSRVHSVGRRSRQMARQQEVEPRGCQSARAPCGDSGVRSQMKGSR